MLCRAAESVFWMSRYVERAENVARFIGVNLELTLGERAGIDGQWNPLIFASGDEKQFKESYDAPSRNNVLKFLLFDKNNPNSLISSLAMARENARVVRDTVSVSFWHKMNRLFIDVRDAAKNDEQILKNPQEFLDRTIESSQTLLGIEKSTISHGEAWHFSRLGRILERADKTSRILDVKYFTLLPRVEDVGKPLDVVQWSALLQSSSALAMYRREHGRLRSANVVKFLVLNPDFPRSLMFCVSQAVLSLQAITPLNSPESQQQVVRALASLVETLQSLSVESIIEDGLHEFIDRFQVRIAQLCDGIASAWFQRNDFAVPMQQQQQ
ncbi:MAG: alpha-E domain-containing protein [Planctomycetaceae bacterium]